MQQIKNILIANDIAGVVVIHTPGYNEYLNHLSPSYSCIEPDYSVNKDDKRLSGFRIRAKSSEIGKEKVIQLVGDTANMLVGLNEVTGIIVMQNIELEEAMAKHVDILRKPGDHTSHTEQNN